MGGDPGEVYAAAVVLDHHEHVEAAQEDGVDVGEVDREDRLGLGGEELSPGRSGPARAGSMPAAFKIFHTVDAAIRWPSPTSSPWMRRYPHLGFSRANRSTSARTGCATGGRPGLSSRVGPAAGDQLGVPAQQGSRRHEPQPSQIDR